MIDYDNIYYKRELSLVYDKRQNVRVQITISYIREWSSMHKMISYPR